VHNHIIEKDQFSTGNIVTIIRAVAPVQPGSKKLAKHPKFGEKAAE